MLQSLVFVTQYVFRKAYSYRCDNYIFKVIYLVSARLKVSYWYYCRFRDKVGSAEHKHGSVLRTPNLLDFKLRTINK